MFQVHFFFLNLRTLFKSCDQWIYPLRNELDSLPFMPIFEGGLDSVLPAETVYILFEFLLDRFVRFPKLFVFNFFQKISDDLLEIRMAVATDWSSEAIALIRSKLDQTNEIMFMPQKMIFNRCFGQMDVTGSNGEMIDLVRCLISSKNGISSEDISEGEKYYYGIY